MEIFSQNLLLFNNCIYFQALTLFQRLIHYDIPMNVEILSTYLRSVLGFQHNTGIRLAK